MKIWEIGKEEPKGKEEPFDHMFLRLFKQEYKYEQYQISKNKSKYLLFKALVLVVIAAIPFLMLFLITKKDFILGKNEWNDIYLYIIIAIPVIFAYLLNRYVIVRHYRETWAQNIKVKRYMEWRMMMFVKDYEMKKSRMNPDETAALLVSLKDSFINDMFEYWRTSTTEYSEAVLSKDENIFQEIGKMLKSK